MTATLPRLAKLAPNSAWASLPFFDRTGWKRVRFGDVVENWAESCDPAVAEFEAVVSGDIFVLRPFNLGASRGTV